MTLNGLAVTVHWCLNGCAAPYLSDYCVPAAGADTRQHLRSVHRQLLATGSTLTAVGPIQLLAPNSGTLSWILFLDLTISADSFRRLLKLYLFA